MKKNANVRLTESETEALRVASATQVLTTTVEIGEERYVITQVSSYPITDGVVEFRSEPEYGTPEVRHAFTGVLVIGNRADDIRSLAYGE